ncbi:WD40 repeat-like protein [Scleroderma citrinum]
MDINNEYRSVMELDDMLEEPLMSGSWHNQLSVSSKASLLADVLPFTTKIQSWKQRQLSDAWARQLDRVNVLGGNDYGHHGCVNALSWAQNGEWLVSSGDDRDIRVWRMDSSTSSNEYPFACQSVINTGHTQNVFNVQMLPYSSRIATVSGDKQVRVFDVGEAVGHSPTGSEMTYPSRQACIRELRCHSGRTKRIITEDSPDLFLTVAEDGTVRQHDLRTTHACRDHGCPPSLVKLPHELSTIALSPLTPYQFVVGGEAPFAHLFDRRHIGRYLLEEWGMSPSAHDATTCVRKFSRRSRARGEFKGHEHITGARMSACNGHEVLLSFNSDAVYLYSTRDEPGNSDSLGKTSILAPNPKRRKRAGTTAVTSPASRSLRRGEVVEDDPRNIESAPMDHQEDSDDSEDFDTEDEDLTISIDQQDDIPVIYPRSRFAGHCNVETIKDVNFLGPHDEYVTSGSDDGNFFIWDKSSHELVDILEGDGSVVNVIEGHPTLPLVVVSGIDATIKLFAPSCGPAKFSRLERSDSIVKRNTRNSRRGMTASAELAHLLMHYDRLQALRDGEGGAINADIQLAQCINQ